MRFIKILKNNLSFKKLSALFFQLYSFRNLQPSFLNLEPKTYNLKPNLGFTLIETLVAISILMIAVASPLTIAQKGLASAIYAKDQIIASYLAQDAIEYIINASGQNVANKSSWLDVIKDRCGTVCSISSDENDFTSSTAIVNCGGSCPVLKYDISSHKYNRTGSDDSLFTRSVVVSETVANVEALITVTMSWKDKNTDRILNFYTRMYNWR